MNHNYQCVNEIGAAMARVKLLIDHCRFPDRPLLEPLMPIPDPSTFIGQRCSIKLRNKPIVIEKILAIDTGGVKVEKEDGGVHVYAFSEIARVALAK